MHEQFRIALIVAGSVLAGGGAWVGLASLPAFLRRRRLLRAPLVGIGAWREGAAAIQGKIASSDAGALSSPLRHEPSVWVRARAHFQRRTARMHLSGAWVTQLHAETCVPFVVEDDSGATALVHPERAMVEPGEQCATVEETAATPALMSLFEEQCGADRVREFQTSPDAIARKFDECRFGPGDPVVVVGCPTKGQGSEEAYRSGNQPRLVFRCGDRGDLMITTGDRSLLSQANLTFVGCGTVLLILGLLVVVFGLVVP